VHARGSETEITVTAIAERLNFPDTTRAALSGRLREDALDPKTAPAFLANAVARELPAELEVSSGDANTLILTARVS